MIMFVISNLLWTQGFSIALPIVGAMILGFFFSRSLLYAALPFLIFSLYFFRNPERVCLLAQQNENVLICPADGKVVAVDQGDFGDGFSQRVAMYLSPLDVHVQWIPMSGMIEDIVYKRGQFSMAFLPKSSELNERNDLSIVNGDRRVRVRQIAGTIARRICCWVEAGQDVAAGQKYGMIRFGSRVEIFLPAHVSILVQEDQRVCGGQTALGIWS